MKKKLTAVALVVCMLAIMLVGASLAYFTDTDEAVNTFTMGKVDIELTEPNWDGGEDGLKIFPGQTYEKDPTITVAKESEDCYLVATVTISNLSELKALYAGTDVEKSWGLSLAGEGQLVSGGVASYQVTAVTDTTAAGATLSGTMLDDEAFITYEEVDDTIVYTYYFKKIQKAEDTQILFEEVNVPAFIENGELSKLTVTVNAYAIQSVGFDDVYEAYDAYVAQEA